MEIRDTRYAKTPDGVYIAYQTTGEGPIDVAWEFDYVGNVDLAWEQSLLGLWLRDFASFARVILHDRRGTGVSSRNVPLPNLETRVSDLLLVLDAVGAERPVLAGAFEGGAANVMLAATHPERVRSIVWFYPLPRVAWSPDFPWGIKPEYVEEELRALEAWGTEDYGAAVARAEATIGHVWSEEEIRSAGMWARQTATPDVARELSRIWYETDVRGLLPSVTAPALLLAPGKNPDDVVTAEYTASMMPDARVAVFGGDLGPDDRGPVLDVLLPFLGIEPSAPELETVLSTVLFTDIVGSTERQAALGDHAWKEVVTRHHTIVRDQLARWRGVENDTAGDGFYATFDGPARAIRCALDIVRRVRDIGLEIRAGVHTGECELVEGKCAGLTVSIGARVAAIAGASEVVGSQTVKDLVAGSGFVFEDRGQHELKGVPDRWQLYSISLPRRNEMTPKTQ